MLLKEIHNLVFLEMLLQVNKLFNVGSPLLLACLVRMLIEKKLLLHLYPMESVIRLTRLTGMRQVLSN